MRGSAWTGLLNGKATKTSFPHECEQLTMAHSQPGKRTVLLPPETLTFSDSFITCTFETRVLLISAI